MATDKTLQLVIVTPEKTLVDQPAVALRFPLYDGGIGILPGRLPLIGRLGSGELVVTQTDQSELRLFIDGGFVQVRGGVVTLLTNKAVFVSDLSVSTAQAELEQATAVKASTDVAIKSKEQAVRSARSKLALARKTH